MQEPHRARLSSTIDDGNVDDLDYVYFMSDFVDQNTDLNLDGTIDNEDFKIFVERWESEL